MTSVYQLKLKISNALKQQVVGGKSVSPSSTWQHIIGCYDFQIFISSLLFGVNYFVVNFFSTKIHHFFVNK
jgi:hypothetical protein